MNQYFFLALIFFNGLMASFSLSKYLSDRRRYLKQTQEIEHIILADRQQKILLARQANNSEYAVGCRKGYSQGLKAALTAVKGIGCDPVDHYGCLTCKSVHVIRALIPKRGSEI